MFNLRGESVADFTLEKWLQKITSGNFIKTVFLIFPTLKLMTINCILNTKTDVVMRNQWTVAECLVSHFEALE